VTGNCPVARALVSVSCLGAQQLIGVPGTQTSMSNGHTKLGCWGGTQHADLLCTCATNARCGACTGSKVQCAITLLTLCITRARQPMASLDLLLGPWKASRCEQLHACTHWTTHEPSHTKHVKVFITRQVAQGYGYAVKGCVRGLSHGYHVHARYFPHPQDVSNATQANKPEHVHRRMRARTHARTRAHTHTHTHTHSHTCASAHKYAHIHVHKHTTSAQCCFTGIFKMALGFLGGWMELTFMVRSVGTVGQILWSLGTSAMLTAMQLCCLMSPNLCPGVACLTIQGFLPCQLFSLPHVVIC